MQADPGGGISISLPTVDWTELVPQLVGLFFDAIGRALSDMLGQAFDGLWNSGANVLGRTPPEATYAFGPVVDQLHSIQDAARYVLIFALIIVGVKGMLGGIVHAHADMVSDFVNHIIFAVIAVAAFPLIIPMVVDTVNAAARAIGTANVAQYVTQPVVGNPLMQAVLLGVLGWFAVRLLIRAGWRIMMLAVLLPVGIACAAVYALPGCRWCLPWWCRMWGMLLISQLPSVFALTIGVQVAAFGGGGLGSFIFAIAALQCAHDVMTLLPFGSSQSGGTPWGGLPWRMPLIASTFGGAAAATAVTAAASSTQMRPQMMADMYGY